MGENTLTETEVKAFKDHYYFMSSDYEWYYDHNGELSRLKTLIASYMGDTRVIWLKSNEEDKFLKKFPKAKNVLTYLPEHFKELEDSLTEDDKTSMTENRSLDVEHWCRKLDPARLDDPAMVRFLEAGVRKGYTDNAESWRDLKNVIHKLAQGAKVKFMYQDNSYVTYNTETPLDKYVLLGNFRSQYDLDLNHIYTYMNAYYKEILNDPTIFTN